MAVKEYKPANSHFYIGASTDTKPAGGSGFSGVMTGDKFLEQDTSKLYVFGSDNAWHEIGTVAATPSVTF